MTIYSVGDLCEFKYRSSLPERARELGDVPVYGSNGKVGFHSEALTDGPAIIVGPKGSIGQINYSARSCWPIDTTYFVDRSATKQDLRWLAHALSSLGLNELNKATGVPGLNRNDAYAKQLYVPPLDQQRRIAAILDQADDLRRKRQQASKKLHHLQKSIFFELFGDPTLNPAKHPLKELKSLGRVVTGSTPSSSKEGMFGGPVPFVTPGDLETDAPVKRSLTHEGARQSRTVRAGSALVCCIGATIGKMGMAAGETAFNQQINAVEWSDEIDAKYGIHVLGFFRRKIVNDGASTTLPILKKSRFEKISIPVPLFALQRTFAARITEIDKLKAHNRAHLAKLDALFASLQHRAFRGQL